MTEKTINYIKLPDGETYKIGGSGSGFNLFDTKISDHILEGEEALGWALQGTYVYKNGVVGSRTGYADFYNKCLEEKELGTAIETTLGDSTITMYVNGNGHKFYDIADKTIVDNWYNTYGIADFYGIDLVNERIFLPRNKYFALTGGVMGNGLSLGLNGGYGAIFEYGNNAQGIPSPVIGAKKGAYGQDVGTNITNSDDTSTVNKTLGITTDPTKSGITLEPNENKYLYICVGNTKVESAISNVTEITTSENDTLPLFYNFYSKEDMTTTGAYVNASLGSWLSGNVYTTAYNELVNKLGTGNVKANTDTYTDYDFVVNQDNMTFRLPIKNGQEIMFATSVKGNGMTLGLTDGTSNYGLMAVDYNSVTNYNGRSTSAYGQLLPSTSSGGKISIPSGNNLGVTTDAVKSGIELDTENITIPDGWNLYYKLSNAVTNLEILDVAKVTADLNTCYKRNAGDNSDLSGLGMPSNEYIDLTLGASGSTYTAPANGWFTIKSSGTASGTGVRFVNLSNGLCSGWTTGTGGSASPHAFIPVLKGQEVSLEYSDLGTLNWFRFIYAEGEV